MRVLISSSAYPPDPAAVGQYIAEAASWAKRRGHMVKVITADRGYEDPRIAFCPYEVSGGVEIVRLRWSSFGKRSLWTRILGQISFSIQALFRGLAGARPDAILVSTTPPFGIAGTWLLSKIRRVPVVYWVMDVNPDQAITMRMVKKDSVYAIVMEKLNALVLHSADSVIALDADMATKLSQKASTRKPIMILPPWPLQETLGHSSGKEFRKVHHLEDKFVVMYSGNHSWVHPLDTVLQAANDLEKRKDILFVFIGRGNEKFKVEAAIRQGKKNLISLPFLPLEDLGESLAAADAHLVVMGNSMAGIVHPCKIYSAMLAGKPILAIAPQDCYISRVLDGNHIGMRFEHGDAGGLVRGILELADMDPEERVEMGRRARALVRQRWNQSELMGHLIGVLEESARREEVSNAL